MTQATAKRSELPDTGEICRQFPLSSAGQKFLAPRIAPAEFIAALAGAGLFPDVMGFIAHLLPAREAIRWAHASLRETAPTTRVAAVMKAIENWLPDPSDANRRAVKTAADTTTLRTPDGCLALAVFFTGPSLAPHDAPAVPPGKFLPAKAVHGSLMLAAVAVEPQNATAKFRRYTAIGMELISGAGVRKESAKN